MPALPLTPDEFLRRLGETARPHLSVSQHGPDAVTVYVTPGADMTSGQLVEAINSTRGLHLHKTFAVSPPVFLVKRRARRSR